MKLFSMKYILKSFLGRQSRESQVDINLASELSKHQRNIFKLYSIKNFRSSLNSCALDLFNLKEKASLRGYLDAKYTNWRICFSQWKHN